MPSSVFNMTMELALDLEHGVTFLWKMTTKCPCKAKTSKIQNTEKKSKNRKRNKNKKNWKKSKSNRRSKRNKKKKMSSNPSQNQKNRIKSKTMKLMMKKLKMTKSMRKMIKAFNWKIIKKKKKMMYNKSMPHTFQLKTMNWYNNTMLNSRSILTGKETLWKKRWTCLLSNLMTTKCCILL